MRDLDFVSFTVKYTEEVSKIKKDLLFKIIKLKEKYYISDFSDSIITQVEPINLSNDAKNFLDNLPVNFASFINHDRKNSCSMMECKRIFKVESNIEKFHLYYEDEVPDHLVIRKAIGENNNALLCYVHIENKGKDSFLIESSHLNKAYSVKEKDEYDSKDDYKKNKLLMIASKEKRINLDNYQEILLIGDIAFTNKKEYISPTDELILFKVRSDIQNYLNLWKEYNRIELEREYELFKQSSYLKYDSISYNDDIKVFFNDDNFKRLKSFKDKMCFLGSSSLLQLFKSNDLDSYNNIEKDLLSNKEITVIEVLEKNTNVVEKSIKIKVQDRSFFHNSIILNSGYICLSLLGNKISYNRREKAKERIITGKSGIQKMYTWFTDNPEPSEVINKMQIDGKLLTKTNLTSNQLDAIDIICNTPDIAIVQGPPGTGKTTTIREALIQINSQQGNKYQFGNNLLSGFRHETVKNLTESIDLFGLPAVKIGESSKDNESDLLEPRIIKFIDDLIDALKEKYKDLTASDDEYIDFKKKYFNYISFNNSIDSSIEILEGIKNLDAFKYDINVTSKIDEMIKGLKKNNQSSKPEEEMFVDFLYSLPISEEAHNDDAERVLINLYLYKNYPSLRNDCELLEKVYNSYPYNPLKIKTLRKELILKYRKQPDILTTRGKKQEIIDYLNELFDVVKCQRLKKFDGDKIAILDYIDSLTENPLLIRDTLLDYTKVLGATNQQSTSKNMYEIKNDDVLFDNVFIDEAATSSPLDLFIPMSLAKKKVILVGDHKQLPNITDEGIIDKVKSSVNKNLEKTDDKIDISKTMKETLFEVLMDKAHELEKKDGIKRVITLNTQFRMHPKLGEIVSRNFYDGIVQSVRPENDFYHNYHGLTNKYLYWLDTPYDEYYKKEYRNIGSKSRKNIPEAKKIAKHIKEALDSKDYQNQTIGVITLFKDQEYAIKDELKKIGIDDEFGNRMPRYASQEILVGTVDAFQGREFDIVYLSLVYLFNEGKNYSRLASENGRSLMCVALSRQRKMLIVVGDMSVYNIAAAKENVKPLYDLAMLCSGGDMHE